LTLTHTTDQYQTGQADGVFIRDRRLSTSSLWQYNIKTYEIMCHIPTCFTGKQGEVTRDALDARDLCRYEFGMQGYD